jgi:hypothetical protein
MERGKMKEKSSSLMEKQCVLKYTLRYQKAIVFEVKESFIKVNFKTIQRIENRGR